MMNQGPPPGAGYRGPPYDGAMKGGVGQPVGNRGPPSSQHFPSSIQNGVSHQSHMNGPTQGQFPGHYSQPIRGTPQKAGLPYQQPPQMGQSPRPIPPTTPQQQQMAPGQSQQLGRPSPTGQPPHSQSQSYPQQHQQMTQQMGGLNIGTGQQNQSGWPSSQTPGRGLQQQQPRGPPPGMQMQSPMAPPQPGMPPMNRPATSMAPPQAGVPPTSHPPASQAPPSSRPGPPSGPAMAPQPGMGAPPTSMEMHPPPTNFGAPPLGMPPSSMNAPPSMGMSQPPMSRPGPPQYSQSPMNSFPGSQGPSAYPGTGPMPGMAPGPMGSMAPGPMAPPQPGSPQHQGMSGPSAMSSPMQQQRRIDPDQMPSPIQVMKDDVDTHKDMLFCTNVRGKVPPLVTTPFVVKDDGNCSPRFMRSTMYNVPNHQDIKNASEIPLALNIMPFADLPPTEAPLRIVDHGANGPVRCNRCRAYINPFVQFIDGGRRFVCNICTYSSEVPPEYFCHLDHQGLRVDLYERPELHCGSYEFVCTTDYCKDQKPPQPPAYIFMIDVSYQSIQCGMVRMLMRELGSLLDHLPREFGQEVSAIRVGFVTYSTALHFYNVKSNLAQPQMMVVTDVEDMFVPLLDGFLVNVQEARSVVDSLLEQIPQMFAESRDTEIVLGPVIQAGVDALKSAGICGKLFIFHSSLPIGEAPGKLKNREDRKLLATEKEKAILSPQSNFYEKTAKQCVEAGVSVDLFLFPNAYTDIATVGGIATITGGHIYRYSYFKEATHGQQFREDLFRNIRQNVAFDGVMRIRASTGLRPVDFVGNFYMSNTTDVELAAMDSRKAIAVEIKHDDKLADDSTAYFQCALLYTSVSGQRRLRIHNLALATCSQLSELFRCCEMDTFVNVICKQAVRSVYTSTPKAIREGLINQCAGILACYRRNCASPSSAGQLILPECMKLLPLYMNCILKNDILMGGSEMSSDDRSWLMRTVMSMDQNASVPYFYPRLMSLHDVDVESTNMPVSIRCSIERMKDNGVYLLENGIVMFLWIGLQVDPQFLQQLFGVTTIGQVDIEMTNLPEFDNPLSVRVRNMIDEIRSQRTLYLKLTIVRQRDKLEPWLKHFLVEDKGMDTSSYSYVDFLCIMHKEIRNLLN